MFIVITDVVVSGWRSTLLTSPTFTPAIRTGERAWMFAALATTALISYGLENGRLGLNAMNARIPIRTMTIVPATAGEMGLPLRRFLAGRSLTAPVRWS